MQEDQPDLPAAELFPVHWPGTAKERELIRREMCRHFGQYPRIEDGLFLRARRTGERKEQPKVPPAVRSMLDRGLVEIAPARLGGRAFFTEAGKRALHRALSDRITQ